MILTITVWYNLKILAAITVTHSCDFHIDSGSDMALARCKRRYRQVPALDTRRRYRDWLIRTIWYVVLYIWIMSTRWMDIDYLPLYEKFHWCMNRSNFYNASYNRGQCWHSIIEWFRLGIVDDWYSKLLKCNILSCYIVLAMIPLWDHFYYSGSKKTRNLPDWFWSLLNSFLDQVHQYWSENLELGTWIMQVCMAHLVLVSDFQYLQNSASSFESTVIFRP